jgi:hypothetical protein
MQEVNAIIATLKKDSKPAKTLKTEREENSSSVANVRAAASGGLDLNTYMQ